MKNKVFSIGVAVILLSLIAVTAPVAAQESQGWQTKPYAPTQAFRHVWTGTLLRTEGGIQVWELYSEKMMTSGMGDDTWVKMTIMWDPLAQKGQIIKFEHHSENLQFTGWTGTIETSNSLDFQVSGLGVGSYKGCILNIVGSFWGVYYPDVEADPFVSGYSLAHESATLQYCCGGCAVPVGGNLLPSSGAVVSFVTLLGAIGAVTIVVGSKKKREV